MKWSEVAWYEEVDRSDDFYSFISVHLLYQYFYINTHAMVGLLLRIIWFLYLRDNPAVVLKILVAVILCIYEAINNNR